jgi:hypothetical protein
MGLREHSSVALLLIQKSKACGKQEFWGLFSYIGFKENFCWHSVGSGEQSL